MKENFIKNEIFILTIMGAFGHNKIYINGITEENKVKFRESLKQLLMEIENKYKNSIGEKEHLNILVKIRKNIETQNKNILNGKTISFGTVQKLLNLYLKYLWCIDIICEPPHCPIDKIILNKLKDYKTSWTKMNKDDYIRAIKKINFVRGKESIAQWELREFSRR